MNLAKNPRDDRVVGDAKPADDLHRAFDDAPDRPGADHLNRKQPVCGRSESSP
jgi:hypothetical protein